MKGARFLLCLMVLSLACNPIFRNLAIPLHDFTPISSMNNKHPFEEGTNIQPTYSTIQDRLANGNAPRNWTVLIYMAADNNEEVEAVQNINEMEIVGSTQQVNILVYVDFRSNTSTHNQFAYTFNITKQDPANQTIISEPLNTTLPLEPNMGDPATLLAFIQFGQNHSEAENYLLILWDKGTGYTGVCYDETSGGDRLLPQEIALVLNNNTIDPITIVAFDASFMGQFELAFEIRDGTEFIVFSEEIVPSQHFPYQIFLQSLTLFEDSSPHLLAIEIVDRYIEAYSPGGIYYSAISPPPSTLCLSAINTSQINRVFTFFQNTVFWLNSSYNTNYFYSAISTARGLTQQFDIPYYIDLGGFAYQLFTQIPIPGFKNYVGNLSLSIQEAVLYHKHLSGAPSASGLSINFDYYDPILLSLRNDTAYDDFLAKFLTIGETQETTILTLSLGPFAGYLDGKGDSVFYRFSPEIAAEHTIEVSAFQPRDEDFDLYLFDSNWNVLTRSVGLSSDEAVQWALVPGTVYYIQVYSIDRPEILSGLGSFEVNIIPNSPINPAAFVLQIGIIVFIICLIAFILYVIWRNWHRIKRAIERYRLRRMARRIQKEALQEAETTPAPTKCSKCEALLPEDAKFCPNCGETFNETPDEPTD